MDRAGAIAAFDAYVSAYDAENPMIRLKIDHTCRVAAIAERVEKALEDIDVPLKVAVMGCVVNGPGEASAADYGIAGGDGEGVVFRKGSVVQKVSQDRLVAALLEQIGRDHVLT